MAHHDIIIIPKNKQSIPERIMEALQEFMRVRSEYCTYYDVELNINGHNTNSIRFNHDGWHWDFGEDIAELIELDKITDNMVEAYKWLLENTDIESDCWNACDAEYGPDSWEEFKGSLESAGGKELIRQFKERYKL